MAKPLRNHTQEEITKWEEQRKKERLELLQLPDNEFIVTKKHTFAGVWYYYKLNMNKDWVLQWQNLYNDAKPYREGLAAVKMNGKWGFIDKVGSIIIPCKYDDALYFRNGFAAVNIDH